MKDKCPRCGRIAKEITYAPDMPPGGAAYYCSNPDCSVREFVRNADGTLYEIVSYD